MLGWNDPDDLARRCIADVQTASHGLARYAVARRVEVDGFLVQCAALARWSRPAGPTPVCHHGLQL